MKYSVLVGIRLKGESPHQQLSTKEMALQNLPLLQMSETEKKQRGGVQFKPGQSGNPNGRPPKGYSITEMMKEMLNNKPEVKQAIGAVIAAKAMEGDATAIKTLWQYMDGMPKQGIELTGEDGGAIQQSITVKFE